MCKVLQMRQFNNPVTVTLDSEVEVTNLSEDSESVLFCRVRLLQGRRLIGELSAPAPPHACIRIDCEDAIILGEVVACWHESGVAVAAIDLQQALTGLGELASMREEFWGAQERRAGALQGCGAR